DANATLLFKHLLAKLLGLALTTEDKCSSDQSPTQQANSRGAARDCDPRVGMPRYDRLELCESRLGSPPVPIQILDRKSERPPVLSGPLQLSLRPGIAPTVSRP